MGTLGEIAVVHRDERYAQGAMDAAFQELERVESLLTRFRADSEVGRVNLGAFSSPQPVCGETVGVLQASLSWAQASDGAFDPCLASAVRLWDVGNRQVPPDVLEVRRFAGRGLYRALEVDRFAGDPVVLFHQEDMGLDLGGIGKGYGVDRAVEVLRSWGIRDAIVNLGGDLYAMGASEDGDPWKVGVRSPDDPGGVLTSLSMTDRAVATSGDYLQHFEHRGRRYHHLLDPRTGGPARSGLRTVTVAAATCMAADAGATTAFVVGPEGAVPALGRVAPGSEVVHSA
jgi:thiamine biosynthesis lipoprotein